MPSESLKIVAPPRSGEAPTVRLQPLPPGMKHRFHAMVKPVGSMCNLDCTYCYYLHKDAHVQRDMPQILRRVRAGRTPHA